MSRPTRNFLPIFIRFKFSKEKVIWNLAEALKKEFVSALQQFDIRYIDLADTDPNPLYPSNSNKTGVRQTSCFY